MITLFPAMPQPFEAELDPGSSTVKCNCGCGDKSDDYKTGFRDGIKACFS